MAQHQYSLALIQHEVNNSFIAQRAQDGYINATELCSVAGKPWHRYVPQEENGKFLRALEARTGIPQKVLVQEVKSGNCVSVWIHPKVAVHLAQWLSPDFAAQVSEWVYEWMSKGTVHQETAPATLPHHLTRYIKNDANVPPGYFSILQETGLSLFGPLHNLGFEIPKGWVPDISVGKLFCAWLRKEHGVDTDSLPTYEHDYLDGRIVSPKLYPDEFLAEFRRWFRTIWLPEHGVTYFRKKDPSSLAYVDRLPALAAPKTAANLPKF